MACIIVCSSSVNQENAKQKYVMFKHYIYILYTSTTEFSKKAICTLRSNLDIKTAHGLCFYSL